MAEVEVLSQDALSVFTSVTMATSLSTAWSGAFQHLHRSFIVPYMGSVHFKGTDKNCSIKHGNFTLF